jgi:uncharacterized protein YdaL
LAALSLAALVAAPTAAATHARPRSGGQAHHRLAARGACAKHRHRARGCLSRRRHAPVVVGRVPFVLPAPPPAPSVAPIQPLSGYREPTALLGLPSTSAASTTGATHAFSWRTKRTRTHAKARAASQGPSTLVLYDSTNTWGWLGELYAIGAGNLASHFGAVTSEPVIDYQAGQLNSYTATVYIGSTYDEPIPTAFLNDALASSHPVIWAGWNVWQLSGAEGSAADLAFQSKYGWDPSSSWIDSEDNPLTVSYKQQTFTRNALDGDGMLAPHLTNPAAVNVLAAANCGTPSQPANCGALAQSSGTSFPWAIRSQNLTYLGEVPFSYMSETDRYVAFSDLLFAALAPSAAPSHVALIRLEDVSPISDPKQLRRFADYLSGQKVPFSVNVIPEYTDPNGYYTAEGTPLTITLKQAPEVVKALKYIQSKGGTLNQEGYTHQYSNINNPYDGVSGDDAEFFRAQCSSTPSSPYSFGESCEPGNWVIWTGPLPGDSESWAASRVKAGQSLFKQAGFTIPNVWITPHYFASAADYHAIDKLVPTRYDRDIFPSGLLGGSPNYSRLFGQFFPYTVHDAYGEKVIPENLGDFEPTAVNNNPVRCPQNIIENARVNLAVTQGVASFFFDPASETPSSSACYNGSSDPLTYLQEAVEGVKKLGYTFVATKSL